MDNTFTVQKYFTKNYGMGNRPIVPKMKIKPLGILIMIACLIPTFLLHAAFIIGFLVLGFVFIGLPVIKQVNAKNKAKEWDVNYDIRKRTWDQEFDKFYAQRINALDARNAGLQKLGISNDDLKLDGKNNHISFSFTGQKFDSYYRQCRDGKSRTNHNEISWLFFTDDQVLIYTIDFKLTENTKMENTQEFFYSDIVSVSTGTSSIQVSAANAVDSGKEESIQTEELRLVVPGDKICFNLISAGTLSNAISTMKTLLREKKKA